MFFWPLPPCLALWGGVLISCDPSSGSSVDSSPESFDATGQWKGYFVEEDGTVPEEYSVFFDINCKYPENFFFVFHRPGDSEINDSDFEIIIYSDEESFKEKALYPYTKDKEGDLTVISCDDGTVIKYKIIDNDTIECAEDGLILTRIKETYEIKFVPSEGSGASD